jgi:hypothetical protein
VTIPPDFVYYLASQAIAGVAVYAAIRADLREALVRVAHTERRLDVLEGRKA